jgi:thioredoxin 1
MLGPIVEDIAVQCAESLSVTKVNIDEQPDIAERYGVQSIPTLIVFAGGQPVRTVVGSKPKAALLRELAEFL